MRSRTIVLCWATLSLFVAWFAPPIHAESYARVCVTSIDPNSNEVVLADDSLPGAEKKLVVHLDANTECTARIVPLTEKGSHLANGWRPQMVVLPQWDERTLPNSRAAWEWNKPGQPFGLWVFFFRRAAAGLNEIEK